MKKIAVITGASGGLGKEFVRQIINEVDEVWANSVKKYLSGK